MIRTEKAPSPTAKLAAHKPKTKAPAQEAGSEPKDWTVIMYLDGDNDAEERITKALYLLERKAGSTDKVNIVAQLGRLPQDKLEGIYKEKGYEYEPTHVDGDWSGIRRFYVTKHEDTPDTKLHRPILSECTEKLADDVHMAEATTLGDCLISAIKKYPAKNYLVCMADHGGSVLGAMTSDGTPEGHAIMNPSQINKALELVEKATGAKPAVVDMAACLMASSEVAYQLKDRAQYYLASQEVTSKTYQHYGEILADLTEASAKGKPMTPKALGERIVEEYNDKPQVAPDKSLVDLSKMQDLSDSVTSMVGALKKTKIAATDLATAIQGAQHFGMHGDPITSFSAQTRDLYGIATHLQDLAKEKGDRNLGKAAGAVAAAVESAVVVNHASDYSRDEVVSHGLSSDGKEKSTTVVHYEGHYDAHGLSLFAPTNQMAAGDTKFQNFLDSRYNYLTFAKDTGWGDWLADFNKEVVKEKAASADKVDAPEYQSEVPNLYKR